MIDENHRHVFHHTANILVVSLMVGLVAAILFVLVAEFFYARGGFVTLLVLFSAAFVYPAGGAYKRAVVDKTARTDRCVFCE